MSVEINTLNNKPAPDWGTRPWGRPIVHLAKSEAIPRLVGTVHFQYHGIHIQGVRIYLHEDTATLSVNMPTKRFGDSIESVLYFVDAAERDLFEQDVTWLWQAIFGRAYAKQHKSM